MDLEQLVKLWSHEELAVLERSPEAHDRITSLLEKPDGNAGENIGSLIRESLEGPVDSVGRKKAARLVWDILKDETPPAQAEQVVDLLSKLDQDPWAIVYLKKLFKVVAKHQGRKDLACSSYILER